MSDYGDYGDMGDDDQQEYRAAMAEGGYPEFDFDEGLEGALDQLDQDLNQCPQGIQMVIDLAMGGTSIQDALYQAGYCQGSENLYHIMGTNNGMGMKDKIQHAKGIHQGGKQRVSDKRSSRAEAQQS
jgi:hypothetical protein